MRVVDAMTRDVVTVAPDTPLKTAARVMAERGVSGLPVTVGGDHVVGVVSESDIVYKEAGSGRYRGPLRGGLVSEAEIEAKRGARVVADAMTSPAITIHPEYTIADAARLMVEHGVNRMPVVQDGKLLGILTRADLICAFARHDDEVVKEIQRALSSLMVPYGAVDATLHDGEVWLAGTLGTPQQAEMVVKAVEAVAGVVAVHSLIHVRMATSTAAHG